MSQAGSTATGGSIVTPVTVASGGTGDVNLTAHGVLIGEGINPVHATTAGIAGQVLTSNGAGVDPTFQGAAGGLLGVTNTLTPFTTALGYNACNTTSGINNTAVGWSSMQQLTTGIDNTALGFYAGANYTGAESGNICIGFDVHGTTGESNVTRIGKHGTQSAVYVDGIYTKTPVAAGQLAIVDVNDQIGTLASGTAGQVLTSNGALATPTFQALPTALIGVTDTLTPFTTALGYGASGSVTGVNNTAVGWHSLTAGTTAYDCTALGYNALTTNQASYGCTAIGSGALHTVNGTGTQGRYATAVGYTALYSLTTGAETTALGANALYSVTTGNSNTAFGYAAAYTTNGNNNVALGNSALKLNTSGTGNTCLGYSAGSALTGAEGGNIYVGYLVTGTVGDSYVTRIGTGSSSKCFVGGITGVTPGAVAKLTVTDTNGQLGTLASGTAGNYLASSGAGANPGWATFPAIIGTINGDTGSVTGSTVSVITGNFSQNCGSSVLFSGSGTTLTFDVTDGSDNTLIGNGAGNSTLNGTENTSVGTYALHSLGHATGNGSHNSAFGSFCLTQLTEGTGNNGHGYQALESLTTGNYNCSFGESSGNQISTGSYNTFLGYSAGNGYTGAESNNISINNVGTAGESNTIRIGSISQNKCFIAGISGATVTGSAVLCDANGQLGTIPSSQRYKDNIQDIGEDSKDIYKLRPVSFNYKSEQCGHTHYGLIAEEVESVYPELVVYDAAGLPNSVEYHEFPALLLNEIKNLKKEIDGLKLLVSQK